MQSPDFDPTADCGGERGVGGGGSASSSTSGSSSGSAAEGASGGGGEGAAAAVASGGGGGGGGGYGAGGDRLEYRERTRRSVKTPSPPPVVFAVSGATPQGLEKKVKLMRHFRQEVLVVHSFAHSLIHSCVTPLKCGRLN